MWTREVIHKTIFATRRQRLKMCQLWGIDESREQVLVRYTREQADQAIKLKLKPSAAFAVGTPEYVLASELIAEAQTYPTI